MVLTCHAQARKCQRSVPSYVVSAVYEFGTPSNVRGWLNHIRSIEKPSIWRAIFYPRPITAALNRYIGVYVVVGDSGNIVTVARGSTRFPRH